LGAARLSSLLQEVEDSALLNRFEKASEALQHLESEASRACRWIGDYEHLSAGATGP
jgi:hypothetical protein